MSNDNFTVEAVFFNKEYVDEKNGVIYSPAIVFSKGSGITGKQVPIIYGRTYTNFQFWGGKSDFAFFGIEQIKLILTGSEQVIVSDVQITYGESRILNSSKLTEASLKLEPVKRLTADDDFPEVVIAIPCPTPWGKDGWVIKLFNFNKMLPFLNLTVDLELE